MLISVLKEGQYAEVVALWNEAVEAQGEGYEEHRLSAERLAEIASDDNFLPSGALVAMESDEVVGFALGYVQTVDFHREGNLEAKPGRLAGVAVKPGCWREGIGRKLLEVVEAILMLEGKTAVAFETFSMPISLVRGPYLDSGPYRFLLACGYRPLGHELLLRNDLVHFGLTGEIRERRDRLAREGIEYRLCEAADHDELLAFMARHFPGAWHTSVQRATEGLDPRPVLLALAGGEIAGFMGPFSIGQPGEQGHFGSPGVAPEFRGHGIGKVMFNLGLDHLKQAGANETSYSTGVANPARFIYFDSGAEVVNVFCCHLHKPLANA